MDLIDQETKEDLERALTGLMGAFDFKVYLHSQPTKIELVRDKECKDVMITLTVMNDDIYYQIPDSRRKMCSLHDTQDFEKLTKFLIDALWDEFSDDVKRESWGMFEHGL